MKQIIEVCQNDKAIKVILSGTPAEIGEGVLSLLEIICQHAPELGYQIYEPLKEWRENDGKIPL